MSELRSISRISNRRSLTALVLCILIIIVVFIGVVIKLTAPITATDPDEGMRAFRYFTVLSNIVMGFCAAMCIPFAIDGRRYGNYHLPRWAVYTLYTGVTGVAVTFVTAVCFLGPVGGYDWIMFRRANLYLHTISPILSLILFLFVNDDHTIRFPWSLVSILPMHVYGKVYYVEVFSIGAAAGGWRDHYRFGEYLEPYQAALAFLALGLIVSNVIRVIHNLRHKARKKLFERYYTESELFACEDVLEAVRVLASIDRESDRDGELIVPRRAIRVLKQRYDSSLSIRDLCKAYCDCYLEKEQ